MSSLRSNAAFVPAAPLLGAYPRNDVPASSSSTSTSPTKHAVRTSVKASIVMAPGQGAQFIGMGQTWKERSSAAAKVFAQADELLGEDLGAPLSELLSSTADDAAATLSRTDIAQPAIFVTSIACWEGMKDLGLAEPLSVASGLSLGEYTALTLADAISFPDALRLVKLRGRAMQDAAEASRGGMVALIGASVDDAQSVVEACCKDSVLVAANFNAPGQVVLSGSLDAVDRAAVYAADELKLRVAKLDVAGAFHSPLMVPAAERLATALEDTHIAVPSVPVLSNVTARPHEPDSIRQRLVDQLTNPVLWADCCKYIMDQEAYSGLPWVELAPGKTLSGIMRKINRKVKVENFSEAPDQAVV